MQSLKHFTKNERKNKKKADNARSIYAEDEAENDVSFLSGLKGLFEKD